MISSEKKRVLSGSQNIIDGSIYPRLIDDNVFVPMRRWIHLDLKGAPYKVRFLYIFKIFVLKVSILVNVFFLIQYNRSKQSIFFEAYLNRSHQISDTILL